MSDSIQLDLDRDGAERILYNLDPMSNVRDLSNGELKSQILYQLTKRKVNEQRFLEEINKLQKEELEEFTPSLEYADIHTHNTRHISTNMSHLQGEVRAVSYTHLTLPTKA